VTIAAPPATRIVSTSCLTEAGWLLGGFHVPIQQSFGDFLQNGDVFLPMTDVTLPGESEPRPFFALRREDIRLALPDPREARIETITGRAFTSPWSVVCLLEDGVLEGQIDFLTNQRLSDHLRAARGYLLVREASWRPHAAAEPSDAGPAIGASLPVALVSTPRIVGIAEATAQRGHGHPGRYNTTESDYEVG